MLLSCMHSTAKTQSTAQQLAHAAGMLILHNRTATLLDSKAGDELLSKEEIRTFHVGISISKSISVSFSRQTLFLVIADQP